ncbi:MAG: hypothetical protein ACKOCD_04390 [Nitrospiraceae bacterium]
MTNAAAGIACLVLSCLLYAGLVVLGETAFWLGCLLAGRELMRRYRHQLNPRTWFSRPSGEPTPPDSPQP